MVNVMYNLVMSTAVQIFVAEPWAKRGDESDLEFELFKSFRDTQPMQRPALLAELCRIAGLEDWQIKDIANKKRWLIRCAKYDTYLDASRRQGAILARFELGAKMVKLSQAMMEKTEQAIEWLENNDSHPSYREAVEMARLSIELQRAGFGLQGVATVRDESQFQGSDSPGELIEAAVQVNMVLRRKAESAGIDPNNIVIDNDQTD